MSSINLLCQELLTLICEFVIRDDNEKLILAHCNSSILCGSNSAKSSPTYRITQRGFVNRSRDLFMWALCHVGLVIDEMTLFIILAHASCSATCLKLVQDYCALFVQEDDSKYAEWVCAYAAKHGRQEIIEYLASDPHTRKKYPWNEWTCASAAEGGHLEILQWLRQNGCPWDVQTCYEAAENGHLDILQWAYENSCPIDSSVYSAAAWSGRLDIVKWLWFNKIPWNPMTIVHAIVQGHSHILEWATTNHYQEGISSS